MNAKTGRKAKIGLLKFCIYASVSIVGLAVLGILGYIVINGLGGFSRKFFLGDGPYDTGLLSMIVTTFYMIGLALLAAAPIGIACAIYLVEYARRGNRLVRIIRITTESLAGIPSIIFGLFGMLFFVIALKWSFSLLAGAMTLAIMVLPTIIRATEEALSSVPDTFREGSYGIGAGKLRTVFIIVLPSAARGILSGVILSIGRIVGETAALMLTAGTMMRIPTTLFQSARTLSVHMYMLASEGAGLKVACATAMVLVVAVIAINMLAKYIVSKMQRV